MNNKAPYRQAHWADQAVDVERRDDGSIILKSPHARADAPKNLLEPINKWATERPDQAFIAQRGGMMSGKR